MDGILTWINNIKLNYNVNPVIFGVLYFGFMPPFWYGFYKLVRSIKDKRFNKIAAWLLVCGFSLIAPFLYVIITGRNVPIWVWITIVCIIAVSIVSLISKLSGRIKQ